MRLTIAALIALPIVTMGAIHSAAAYLDQATRYQCATQDWPVERHAAHSEFCRAYLAANP